MAKVITLFCIFFPGIYLTEQASFLSQDYINNINKVAKTWKAGVNFDPNTPKEAIIKILGSKDFEEANKPDVQLKISDINHVSDDRIHKHFDARRRWRYCKTIGDVRDQGNCGSCWAFGTTGAFADRLCVATNGKVNQQISAEELTFCCDDCGDGCDGGCPFHAWKYIKEHGVVTGGAYNTTDGCQPYKVKPCVHGRKGEGSCSSQPDEENHDCLKSCYGDRSKIFKKDHWRTRDYYFLDYSTIQKDIQTYGPVTASFRVYDDFFSYKSGVYVRTENATFVGGHAVKLIGWGVERGVNYWLLVNSWGTSWGDKGLFKIRRGTNECLIDKHATGGVPRAGPN